MSNFDIPEPEGVFRAPYPAQYRTEAVLKDASPISIRPIRPEDASLLVEFFNGLSQASVILRFLAPMKALSPEWVIHLTRIDYTQDVALVALKEIDFRERILGVCRIMGEPDSKKGELAVVITDRWQGKGMGKILSQRAISIAKELGMTSIWGIVSPQNKIFLALADKLGFTTKLDATAGLYQIDMDLIPSSR
jgi:acetyltransferase